MKCIRIEWGLIVGISMLLVAGPAATQDWGSDSPETQRRSQARRSTRAFDDNGMRGYRNAQGPYVQAGATVGVIDFDGRLDSDAGGGVTLTGGYRFLSWLSAEANFTYVGGGDVEFRNTDIGEAEYFGFTFGPKFYPLAAINGDEVPEFLQPYALVAIGGGEVELDLNGSSGFDDEESTFLARFILGLDIWITDNWGTFVEGGYHTAADDDIDGVGVFSFGGQYRF